MTTTHKLTDAQAEVIRDLGLAGQTPGADVLPEDIWSCRDNTDNAKRRTARMLLATGLFGPSPLRGRFKVTQAALDAYDEWYDRRGHRVTQWSGRRAEQWPS